MCALVSEWSRGARLATPGVDAILLVGGPGAGTACTRPRRSRGEFWLMATVAHDRNQLFGTLAFQTGFIEQARLAAAYQAWKQEKGKSLAEFLVDRGDLDAGERSALEELIDRHLRKHGDLEKSLAALTVSRDGRGGFLSMAELVMEATLTYPDREEGGQPGAGLAPLRGAGASSGERFQILRPHARGGLGAVFVALDKELRREVALKQILDQHADHPVSRARFLAEAEITGGLEHPGIVPVYGLGRYPDGRPYYAMRFIHGDSLKDAADRFHKSVSPAGQTGQRSLELRKLLRRFLDVCNAVDYAHSRGVIHRDIKPANIVLGEHGETLVVDWGLAKAVGRAEAPGGAQPLTTSASGSSETLPGSTLGTPSYMSPEQAAGELDRLGPRSDVYSLGATLYFILTGRPPFSGKDVGSVLQAVRAGDFTRPALLDPGIDRALESICLKAMALDPEARYATPNALAEDLERWMADEPVSAWQEPLSRRLRRWARRNRTAVSAASVALVAALVGLGATAQIQARANAELRGLNRQLKTTNADLATEKARVQERFDLAMDAIQTFHTGVSKDFLLREKQFKALRDKLLRSAADFYARLGALLRQGTDRGSKRALARSEYELAELTAKVGDVRQSLDRHLEVLAFRKALAAEPGADAETAADAAQSLTAVANRQHDLGQSSAMEATYRQAVEALSGLVVANPNLAAIRSRLATAESDLGTVLGETGRITEGLEWLKRARDTREALVSADPSNESLQLDLADVHAQLARNLWDVGRASDGLSSGRRAMEILERLVKAIPDSTEYRSELIRSQLNLSQNLNYAGQSESALELFRAARDNARRLVGANPAVYRFQGLLATSLHNLANCYQRLGRSGEALPEWKSEVEIYRGLVRAQPEVLDYHSGLAGAYCCLSQTQGVLGQSQEALESARRGLEAARQLLASNPERTNSQFLVALALSVVSQAEIRLGRRAEAAATLRQVIAAWESIPEQERDPDARFNLVCALARLSGVLAGMGAPAADEARATSDRAIMLLRENMSLGFRDLDMLKNDPALDPLRNRADFRLLLLDVAFPLKPFAPGAAPGEVQGP